MVKRCALKRQAHPLWKMVVFAMLLLVCFGWISSPVLADVPQQGAAGGLQVTGALLDLQNVVPGQVYTHNMVVSIGAQMPPMKISVEARGFGSGPNGEFIPLRSTEDASPYSARSYITKISAPSFRLEPGGSMPVDVTLVIPPEIGKDTHYAMIYIHSEPIETGGNVSAILSQSVPVVVTPQGALLNRSGEIKNLTVETVEAGKPIEIVTTVANIGNRHFKVMGTAVILDSSNAVVAELPIPPTGTSIIPTFSRQLRVSYSALDRPQGLQPGKYAVQVQITMDDGTPVGRAETTFEVIKPYRPFPQIDDKNILIKCFNNEEPGRIDARKEADTEIEFESTGPVTGCVAVGKYAQPPQEPPLFSDDPGNGGTGSQAVKYIAVQVEGFDQGKARFYLRYTPSELGNIDANSLFMALKESTVWRKLDNLLVQTGAELAIGEVAVSALRGETTIALGGVTGAEQPAEEKNALLEMLQDIPLTVVFAAVGALVLIVVVVIVVLSTRKPKKRA